MIKLVMVDFDDTLSMTEDAFFGIENHVAQTMGFEPMTREAHRKNWGRPIQKAIVERIPGIDPDEFLKRLGEILPEFVKTGQADTISDENIRTLEALKKSGRRLAILTSRKTAEARHLLDENHHINRLVEKIYHADNLEFLKPDPRAFRQGLADFNTMPDEAVYVGDSVSDGISAKGAGLHFIALLESGLRSKKEFEATEVDYFAEKFADITAYIDAQGN